MWKYLLIFIVIFLLHLGIEFYSWACHPGNAAVETSGAFIIIWHISSFPLITCLPASIVETVGMLILLINSFLWASIIVGLLWFIRKQKTKSNHTN